MRHCNYCGGIDLPLHRIGESGIYSRNPGAPLYACSVCDPITPETADRFGIVIIQPKTQMEVSTR